MDKKVVKKRLLKLFGKYDIKKDDLHLIAKVKYNWVKSLYYIDNGSSLNLNYINNFRIILYGNKSQSK